MPFLNYDDVRETWLKFQAIGEGSRGGRAAHREVALRLRRRSRLRVGTLRA